MAAEKVEMVEKEEKEEKVAMAVQASDSWLSLEEGSSQNLLVPMGTWSHRGSKCYPHIQCWYQGRGSSRQPCK